MWTTKKLHFTNKEYTERKQNVAHSAHIRVKHNQIWVHLPVTSTRTSQQQRNVERKKMFSSSNMLCVIHTVYMASAQRGKEEKKESDSSQWKTTKNKRISTCKYCHARLCNMKSWNLNGMSLLNSAIHSPITYTCCESFALFLSPDSLPFSISLKCCLPCWWSGTETVVVAVSYVCNVHGASTEKLPEEGKNNKRRKKHENSSVSRSDRKEHCMHLPLYTRPQIRFFLIILLSHILILIFSVVFI